ncbi:uncharacterized protein PHALS_12597 [Plasmopara halstedii]|uniref:Uncharacterized protein n=1 Tax=Plasmopara halstedii TaxID=4781 RepID=A0A0P1AM95_PLAHL|nr:uncharacterized protein PHALS_12597 [Plasmopara halstedii]CEG42313.1 hypothetical protein PHALS_12597 [Plasmopara halstedii]|eukprot:XP_024578682.1 hypothetical protein PHALS_12597 [Plasmopara halstedii]
MDVRMDAHYLELVNRERTQYKARLNYGYTRRLPTCRYDREISLVEGSSSTDTSREARDGSIPYVQKVDRQIYRDSYQFW